MPATGYGSFFFGGGGLFVLGSDLMELFSYQLGKQWSSVPFLEASIFGYAKQVGIEDFPERRIYIGRTAKIAQRAWQIW